MLTAMQTASNPQSTTHRALVVASIMASTAMVALEATIVATAMPNIVADLGGLNLYSWVFASFLLAQTATTVVFGKLADVRGRKPVMLSGIAVFIVASVLAGFSPSMTWMIVFRLAQGFGAGAIVPVAMTIVGDLYRPAERGKVQGYLASVWATCAVLGPVLGSLIIHEFSWSWLFWINVPIGLASAFGFIRYYHEEKKGAEKVAIDYGGAALFIVAVTALMLFLTHLTSPDTWLTAIELAVFVVGSVAFVMIERRVTDPMMSFRLWAIRPIAVCNLATLFSGMAMMGLTTFLPMYLQAVAHRSPVTSGFALTMMMIGWPTGATLAARTFARVGLRRYLLLGGAAVPLGGVCFVFLTPEGSAILPAIGSFLMGLGFGLSSVCAIILIQESVSASGRGSATASNIFARNLGSTLGAAAFGAVQTFVFNRYPGVAGMQVDKLRDLLTAGSAHIAADDVVRTALAKSLDTTFVCIFAVSLLVLVSMLLLPKIELASVTGAGASRVAR
jgi:MFS family permease